MAIHATVAKVTARIAARSAASRGNYLEQIRAAALSAPTRSRLSCGNLAHGFAACDATDKNALRLMEAGNVAIINSYNDMLSAHHPYADYPDKIKAALREMGWTAQVAGGVPAMCDGVTQGQPGMELSLFSRDLIAQCTAMSLSHQMFDAVLALGVCDKIVPGLLIGALSFGHLPTIFVPAGPMESGLPNKEKQRVRQLYAEGKVGREELLQAESDSYHSAGTCTFYGTANSNQVILEALGLQLPGSSFVNPGNPLRDPLTIAAAQQVARITNLGSDCRPIGEIVDERAIVNAVVSLLASGGSTNHTIHLIAIARAAGLIINWDDFSELSAVVPLLARVYPNGQADVNHFHAAGGTGCLFGQLVRAGLMHGDARTVWGDSFADFASEPQLCDGTLSWRPAVAESLDSSVLASVAEPFSAEGGLNLISGNLGRGVVKLSAVASQHRLVEAPALVLENQDDLAALFEAGQLDRDVIVVARFQGPKALGMPELHKLTPLLGSLQDRGFKVALVTDGRMSGASGKVPAAIHLVPEAAAGGPLARVHSGDLLRLDADAGTLEWLGDSAELAARQPVVPPRLGERGVGRELFALCRQAVSSAEHGASYLFGEDD